MSDKQSSPEEIVKRTSEKIWDATSRTFHQATVKATQYRTLVQKKIDLSTLHRKIDHQQHDLGQMIDDLHTRGETQIMEQASVRELLGQLTELRARAEGIEMEMAHLRETGAVEEDAAKH